MTMNKQEYLEKEQKNIVSFTFVATALLTPDAHDNVDSIINKTIEEAREKGITIDIDGYVKKLSVNVLPAMEICMIEARRGADILDSVYVKCIQDELDVGIRAIRLMAAMLGMGVDECGPVPQNGDGASSV